jgi:hypothetical protein
LGFRVEDLIEEVGAGAVGGKEADEFGFERIFGVRQAPEVQRHMPILTGDQWN